MFVDTPESIHHFFILEIGREKEIYPHYFYHKKGFCLNDFSEHVELSVKKSAENLILTAHAVNKKITDFMLLFHSLQFLAELGYQQFESNFTIIENNNFDFKMQSSICHFQNNGESIKDYQTKNQYNIFEIALWDGIHHDSIKRRLFLFNDSLSEAFEIADYHFSKISKKMNEFKKKHSNIEELNEIEKVENLKDDFYENIASDLIRNGIKEVPFHSLFFGCRHSISREMVAVIGHENYAKLIHHNEAFASEINFSVEKYAKKPLDNSNENCTDEEPF